MIDNSPAPSHLVNADALGEELKFYPRRPRLKSAARHDISQRTPKVCSGSEATETIRTAPVSHVRFAPKSGQASRRLAKSALCQKRL